MRIFKSSLIFAPWSCCLMNPKPIRFKQVNNMKRYHPCQFVTGMIVSDRSISGLQCIRLGALSYGRHIPVKQYIHRLAQKKRIASPQYFNPYVSILTDHSTGPCISRQAFAFAWSGSQPNSPRKCWVVHGSKIWFSSLFTSIYGVYRNLLRKPKNVTGIRLMDSIIMLSSLDSPLILHEQLFFLGP